MFEDALLLIAVDEEDLESIDRLIKERNIDIDKLLVLSSVDYNNKTLMYYIVRTGTIKVARFLLENGADIHKTNPSSAHGGNLMYETLLMTTVKYNLIEMSQFLIECGVNINWSDIYGNTALNNACRNKNIEIIKLLLKNGAIITQNTMSTLTSTHYTTYNHNVHVKIIKILLDVDTTKYIMSNYSNNLIVIIAIQEIEIERLNEKTEQLEKEVKILNSRIEELEYRPGGPGYIDTKKRFEQMSIIHDI